MRGSPGFARGTRGLAALVVTRTRRLGWWGATIVGWAGWTGCAEVEGDRRFRPTAASFFVHSTVPERAARDVPLDARLEVCFSTFVDPTSVAPFDLTLSSGPALFDVETTLDLFAFHARGGGPLPPGALVDDRFDAWCPGSVLSITPRSALIPGVTYRMRLNSDIRGFVGESLDTEGPGWTDEADETSPPEPRFHLEFRTPPEAPRIPSPASPQRPTDDETPTLRELFSNGRVFDPERAACGCHAPDASTPFALRRLDLSSPEAAYMSLVEADAPRASGATRVAPFRPSESLLIHKLLRRHDGSPLHPVLAQPMPPEAPLPFRDLVDVARWIEGGARLD